MRGSRLGVQADRWLMGGLLVFSYLSALYIKNRYLLPPRMKITSYNRLHGRLLLIFELVVLYPLASRSSPKPSSLSHQFNIHGHSGRHIGSARGDL